MDFRLLLLIVTLCLARRCCAAEKGNATASSVVTPTPTANIDTTTVSTSTEVTTEKLPSLCETCICKDRFVNCSHRGLEDHFAESQWPKKPMDEVSFEGNLLGHLKAFPALDIKRLILRKNHISRIDDGAFKLLANITELDLSHNELTSEVLQPHVFRGKFSPEAYLPLEKLTVLNLAGNALHTLNQDLFEHLANLKVLNLAGNPLNVIDQHTSIALGGLLYLEELDLSYCNIDELPMHVFHSPKKLKKLDLTGNRFLTPPAALDDAKALEILYLDENPIVSINRVNGFPVMPMLKKLSLHSMSRLTEIGPGAFSRLTALEVLQIQDCPRLNRIHEDALVDKTSEVAVWPPLKKLDLSDNALRYLPAMLVGRWDRLEELDLMNNEWSCDCDNQYLIGSLLPEFGKKLMGDEVGELKCSLPPEHAGSNMTSLSHRKLRCLDLYSAQPEKDAAVLIGMLIGLLLAIPIGLAIFTFWRKGFFFCGRNGPATFSRAFYKRTPNNDEI